ncbi:hypothetical protein FA95DRAFT_1675483 [Auriscalpium vulgare]|uniref:Uncharacterized protein n=1 Tax=Auriscalpium vulgare TaxID=40419 RepID=A0ACB8S803_9AGAM|nr:hypothetical protein FA95DRAFT_1675483 [Auriscalpium vulgare]
MSPTVTHAPTLDPCNAHTHPVRSPSHIGSFYFNFAPTATPLRSCLGEGNGHQHAPLTTRFRLCVLHQFPNVCNTLCMPQHTHLSDSCAFVHPRGCAFCDGNCLRSTMRRHVNPSNSELKGYRVTPEAERSKGGTGSVSGETLRAEQRIHAATTRICAIDSRIRPTADSAHTASPLVPRLLSHTDPPPLLPPEAMAQLPQSEQKCGSNLRHFIAIA